MDPLLLSSVLTTLRNSPLLLSPSIRIQVRLAGRTDQPVNILRNEVAHHSELQRIERNGLACTSMMQPMSSEDPYMTRKLMEMLCW